MFRYSLTVRVDSIVTHARGSLHIVWGPVSSWRPPFDPKRSNDSAALVLN